MPRYAGVHRRTNSVMSEMTVSQARAALPAILDSVEAGEEVTITRHGRPVAIVVRPEALRARRNGPAQDLAHDVADAIDRARNAPLRREGPSASRADELVDELRADRQAR